MLIYDRVAANKRTTWVLMVLFVVVLTALVGVIVIATGMPIGLMGVVGIGLILYALVSYYISTSVVLSISGAHEVTKEEEWEYVRRVENLCIGAGLPMPKTWVLEDSAPNAFATGLAICCSKRSACSGVSCPDSTCASTRSICMGTMTWSYDSAVAPTVTSTMTSTGQNH